MEVETKTVEVKAADVPFSSDGFDAPTIYAEDIRGAATINGVAKLNLVEGRVDPITSEIKMRIVAVLAVPVEMLKNWGPFLIKHYPREAVVNGNERTDHSEA